jgi:hypothetical protein
MEAETTLDEKYTQGVWYDTVAGEFVEIVDSGDTIGLHAPDSEEVYYTFDEDGMSYESAVANVESDFQPVSDEAQEHPERVVSRGLRIMSRNDPNELMGVPKQFAIDLRYARTQVNISED